MMAQAYSASEGGEGAYKDRVYIVSGWSERRETGGKIDENKAQSASFRQLPSCLSPFYIADPREKLNGII
jgi:hypothetical protein